MGYQRSNGYWIRRYGTSRDEVVDLSPRLLAVDLEKQLLPGSFAHAVHHLLNHDFDLPGFDARYRNDETGASAYGMSR